MADWFVDSNASGLDDGTSWTDAFPTLLEGVDALSAGEDLFMAADHSETPAGNVTYAFPGAQTTINRVISALGGSSPETYDKADNIQVDNSSGIFDMIITGSVHFYGVNFKIGDDFIIISAGQVVLFDDCLLDTNRGNQGFLSIGGTGALCVVKFKNTEFHWSGDGAASGIDIDGCMFEWQGGKITNTGTAPDPLFKDGGQRTAVISVSGVDMSAITGTLVPLGDNKIWLAEFHHCLLNSAVALTSGTINQTGTRVLMSGCDDTTGNDLYRLEYVDFWGSTVHDDATFRTTGGAKDPDGNKISWKMVSSANAVEFSEPTWSPPISGWVDSTGVKTFKINGLWDSATNIQNDEAFIRLEFLELAADTDSAFADDRPTDILTAPADQTTNAVAWTISPSMTNANEFELSVTVTVNRVGPVIAHIGLAKPSTTAFFDPKLEIS